MGGYFSDDAVNLMESRIRVERGEIYMKNACRVIGPAIKKNPQMYKKFGVYWWAVKEALQKYCTSVPTSVWFMNNYCDELMKERAWHGDLYHTFVAGVFYQELQNSFTCGHEWIDDKGIDRQYTLEDMDAGF